MLKVKQAKKIVAFLTFLQRRLSNFRLVTACLFQIRAQRMSPGVQKVRQDQHFRLWFGHETTGRTAVGPERQNTALPLPGIVNPRFIWQ